MGAIKNGATHESSFSSYTGLLSAGWSGPINPLERANGLAKTANNSGFYLNLDETNNSILGFYKSPVAAGRGSGGLKYIINPGKPDESILLYRMNSTDPGVMMPELSRNLKHEEVIPLISEWITQLK